MNEPTGKRTTRSRRWVLTRAGLAAAAVAAVPTVWIAQSADADENEVTAATIDMEMVLLAAQLDPPKKGTGLTEGAKDHVLPIEKALKAKKLLDSAQVDGHFGTSTIEAYAKWQEKLGYQGIDANGLPGKTSLGKLGDFTVKNPIDPGSRSDGYGGKTVNTRTKKMLAAADKTLDWKITLVQGSYHPGVPASAGTHDGGGCVDVNVNGLSTKQRWKTVQALRTVGFAAWLRTPEQGFDYHIHATAVSDPDLANIAQSQVHDYFYGKDGLKYHRDDNTPQKYRVEFTWWEKYQRG